MTLHKLPLEKPNMQLYTSWDAPAYIQPGDWVETRSGSGEVEETRIGANNQRQFRIEGFRRWHDEMYVINHLDFAGFHWQNMRVNGSI